VNLAAGVSLPESGKDLQQRRMLVFYQENTRARARSLARLVEGEGKGKGREGLGWARTLHDFFSGTSRAQGWRLVGGKTVKNPSF